MTNRLTSGGFSAQLGNDKGVFQMSWLEVQRTCLDAKRKHFPVFWNVLRAPKCVAPFRLN